MINGLNNKFVPAPKNEVLLYNGRMYDTPAIKGTVFAKKFAEVSRLKKDRNYRLTKKKLCKKLNASGPFDESCNQFSMTELQNATKHLKARGAPGPDKIAPPFLKNLGPSAQRVLLELTSSRF